MGNSRHNALTPEAFNVKQLYAKKLGTTAGIKSYHATMNVNSRDQSYQQFANECKQQDVDPRPFIDWAFERIYPGLPPTIDYLKPFISQYISAGKPDIEHDRKSVLMQNMLNRLKRCKEDRDPVEFMLDPLNEFSYVFVYCIADKLGATDRLPKHIREGALEEVFLKPIYTARFLNFLPAAGIKQ